MSWAWLMVLPLRVSDQATMAVSLVEAMATGAITSMLLTHVPMVRSMGVSLTLTFLVHVCPPSEELVRYTAAILPRSLNRSSTEPVPTVEAGNGSSRQSYQATS